MVQRRVKRNECKAILGGLKDAVDGELITSESFNKARLSQWEKRDRLRRMFNSEQ